MPGVSDHATGLPVETSGTRRVSHAALGEGVPGRVSVVIPVYNGRPYLRQSIESALQQTHRAREIIAVDDGSTDGSDEVLASFGSDIRVIRQPNAGVSAARNQGIRASTGEYLCLLDQDDWWKPNKLEAQVTVLKQDPTVGLVHTSVATFDEVAGALVSRINSSRSEWLIGNCFDRLVLGNGICNSSVMLRRSLLASVGLFDLGISKNTVQDYDMWLRCARRSRFAYIADPLTVYRLHPSQAMWRVRETLTEALRVLEREAGLPETSGSKEYCRSFARKLERLGIAHFDHGERAQARSCFARAFRLDRSIRNAAYFTAACLPPVAARVARAAASSVRGIQRLSATGHRVPEWAGRTGNS